MSDLIHAASGGFAFVLEELDDADVLHVIGELDLFEAPRLSRALAERPKVRTIVVDLSDCQYIDSSGLDVLVRAFRERRERSLAVVLPEQARIRRVFTITGLEQTLPIRYTLAEALAV